MHDIRLVVAEYTVQPGVHPAIESPPLSEVDNFYVGVVE